MGQLSRIFIFVFKQTTNILLYESNLTTILVEKIITSINYERWKSAFVW